MNKASGNIALTSLWWPLLLLFSVCVSDSLWPHRLQHARPPCPSPSPKVCPGSCPLHWWCHPAISSLTPSSPALNLSQHQGLFQRVSSSHHVTKILEFELQPQSFQWIFRIDFLLRLTGLLFLLSSGILGVFPSTTVQRHQFFGALPSSQTSSHNCMWPLEDHSLD